jgi:hypothetical protein
MSDKIKNDLLVFEDEDDFKESYEQIAALSPQDFEKWVASKARLIL